MMSSPTPRQTKVFNCADHAANISEKLQTFYKEKEFFDITLIAGIDNIVTRAHRIVLCASSNYFLTMCRSSLNESNAAEIKLVNVNGATLKAILEFMYTASIELHSDIVKSVLIAADLLQMNTLIAACCDFMEEQLDLCNCLGFLLFADKHSYTELYKKSLAYAYKHFEEVCNEETFLQLNGKQLNTFLSGDDLRIDSQEKLFHSLLAWSKHDEVNREELLYSLLSQHVRFALLDPKFIADNRRQVKKFSESYELMFSWLEWHLSSESPKKQTQKIVFTYSAGSLINSNFNVQTFNPVLNEWSYENWPSPSNDRIRYSMLVLNKKCLLTGGEVNGKITNKVECLDLQSMEWYLLPPMISERCLHGMVELNGNLYVVGGKNEEHYLSSMEKYDFSTRKWQNMTPLSKALRIVKLTILNGLLYAASADEYHLQCFDYRTNKWTQTSSKNKKVLRFGIAAVDAYLYAVGGEDEGGKMSETVERYNPANDTWTVVESLKLARKYPSCTAWNDKLLVCGGELDGKRLAYSYEQYDPQKNEWKSLAPFLNASPMNMFSAQLSIMK